MEATLEKALYDTASPTAFTSKTALIKRFEKEFPRDAIRKWADEQPVLTKYAGIRKTFKRLPTLAHKKNDVISVDLADFKSLSRFNRGYKYLMVCVDTLSRQTYAYPLKSKKSSEVIERLRDLFKVAKPGVALYSDKGGEFSGAVFNNFLKEHGVQGWTSFNETKASLSERKILDLKRRISKLMAFRNSKKWIDSIDDIVAAVNNTYNRSLKMKPSQVDSLESQRKAFMALYSHRIGFTPPEAPLRVGEKKRLSQLHSIFRKRYMQNYTSEGFTLKKILPREGQNLYSLADSEGEPIGGKFYGVELQPFQDDNNLSVGRLHGPPRKKRRRRF
jgi:hypothetical protein